jgi:hypothetical protein
MEAMEVWMFSLFVFVPTTYFPLYDARGDGIRLKTIWVSANLERLNLQLASPTLTRNVVLCFKNRSCSSTSAGVYSPYLRTPMDATLTHTSKVVNEFKLVADKECCSSSNEYVPSNHNCLYFR